MRSSRRSCPAASKAAAPTSGMAAITIKAIWSEPPLASLIAPNSHGATKPLMLPTELIRAIPPAAAMPESIAVGNGQKSGPNDWMPMTPMIKAIVMNTGCVGPMKAQASNPAVMIRSAATEYTRRLPV